VRRAQIGRLRLENRILKQKAPGRIRFTDEERRYLVEAALAMGRLLMKEAVGIVKPETILAWQRRLERSKWDYSARRRRGPGRPRTADDIEALICRLAGLRRANSQWQVSSSWAACSTRTTARPRSQRPARSSDVNAGVRIATGALSRGVRNSDRNPGP
jgi:hypothetical protein